MKFRVMALAIGLLGPVAAQAAGYTYIGSFSTDGQVITFANNSTSSMPAKNWQYNPPVYSGIEAASLLFGNPGSNYIYAISTDYNTVNHLAWYDGWDDHDGHQYSETYKLDVSGLGYSGCYAAGIPCSQSAYSAYVADAFVGTNYVFAVAVPESETWAMLLAGLGLMGVIARRRKTA